MILKPILQRVARVWRWVLIHWGFGCHTFFPCECCCWQHSCYSFILSDLYEQKTHHTCTSIGTKCGLSKLCYSYLWKMGNIYLLMKHNLISFCFYSIYQIIFFERNCKDPIPLTYWYLLKEILNQHRFEPIFNITYLQRGNEIAIICENSD